MSSIIQKRRTDLEFGYLAAGHGYKGKQYPLETDEDLADVYA